MLKSLRVPEKLFQLVMWLVSLAFAAFLIGLGSQVVHDLPKLEENLSVEQFADQAALQRARESIARQDKAVDGLADERDRAQLAYQAAGNAYASARGAFENWLGTRSVITGSGQDPELVSRTRQLDGLRSRERDAQAIVEQLDQRLLLTRQDLQKAHADEAAMLEASQGAYDKALFWQELRVFGARLAITLPLLAVAGWLVARKRRSEYWPLMRGFVLFALFTFFFELVPYLPSYGGYVRYVVGIVLTVIVGHYVIKSMRAYLARRQLVERQTQQERRQALGYEDALKKMGANVCPGCDRAILTTGSAPSNFCVHCGMTLYVDCRSCHTRRNAFFHFCPACGVASAPTDAAPVAESESPGRAGEPGTRGLAGQA